MTFPRRVLGSKGFALSAAEEYALRALSIRNPPPPFCFTIAAMPGTESYPVRVASESGDQQWTLTTSRRGRDWLITLADHDGNSWAAEGPDLFEALRALRRAVDPLGIRLGVNGARRNAWASGMQRDMGEGRVVYLLTEGETGRPPQVSTLGSASLAAVGSVREQDEQYARWLSPGQRPGDGLAACAVDSANRRNGSDERSAFGRHRMT